MDSREENDSSILNLWKKLCKEGIKEISFSGELYNQLTTYGAVAETLSINILH